MELSVLGQDSRYKYTKNVEYEIKKKNNELQDKAITANYGESNIKECTEKLFDEAQSGHIQGKKLRNSQQAKLVLRGKKDDRKRKLIYVWLNTRQNQHKDRHVVHSIRLYIKNNEKQEEQLWQVITNATKNRDLA